MKRTVKSRIRITRTGKIIRRKMGVNHFRAKKNAKQIRNKRKTRNIKSVDIKTFIRYT